MQHVALGCFILWMAGMPWNSVPGMLDGKRSHCPVPAAFLPQHLKAVLAFLPVYSFPPWVDGENLASGMGARWRWKALRQLPLWDVPLNLIPGKRRSWTTISTSSCISSSPASSVSAAATGALNPPPKTQPAHGR